MIFIMSIVTKIALGIGAVLLIVGSTLVTIAALFQPRNRRGRDEEPKKPEVWDESIEDV